MRIRNWSYRGWYVSRVSTGENGNAGIDFIEPYGLQRCRDHGRLARPKHGGLAIGLLIWGWEMAGLDRC